MAPVLGHVEGDDDEVREADGDLVQASRAQVGLSRLERMDERNLQAVVGLAVSGVLYPSAAHNTSSITTTNAATTST